MNEPRPHERNDSTLVCLETKGAEVIYAEGIFGSSKRSLGWAGAKLTGGCPETPGVKMASSGTAASSFHQELRGRCSNTASLNRPEFKSVSSLYA